MELGTYVDHNGRPAVRFVRTYPQPVDAVWAAITEPEQLRAWFPSWVDLEPRVGGAVTFSHDPYSPDSRGQVLGFDRPHHFSFTWGSDELHLDLAPVGTDHCRLTLTNVLSERDAAARNASGWLICLGELDAVVAGRESDGPHSAANTSAFAATYGAHVAAGLPSGADVPTV